MPRRAIVVVLALVVLFVGLPVVVFGTGLAMAFLGNRPLEDGHALGPHVTTVVDQFAAVYVIDVDAEGDGVALVDAGLAPESLGAALRAHGVEPADVRAVFLTHGHRDHVGGIDALPNAQVYALSREVPLLQGEVASTSPMGRLTGASDSGVRLTRGLRHGDRVQVGGVEVLVWSIPGHTAGSAAYLARGVLFLGDSARGGGDGALRAAPWVFSDDTAQNAASLRALAKEPELRTAEVEHIVFGHTGPLEGAEALEAF